MATVTRRRDLFPISVAGAFGLLALGSRLYAEEAIRWSSAVNGLSIGLHLEPGLSHGHLLIFLKNVASTPKALFVSVGDVPRIEFTATIPDRKEFAIRDRRIYRPCAGLCDLPLTEHLNPGVARKSTFAVEDLLYVPPQGQYINLGILLRQGSSVRAAFEVTEQQLKDSGVLPEDLWLGRVVSGETSLNRTYPGPGARKE